jgi:hypothetical protein
MNPEQMGIYEQVERDLRMALKSLSEPYMDEIDGIQEMRLDLAVVTTSRSRLEFSIS